MNWESLSFKSIRGVVSALISLLSDACEQIVSVGELPGTSPSIKEIRLLLIPKMAGCSLHDAETSPDWGRVRENLQLLQNQGVVVPLNRSRYLFKHAGGMHPVRLICSTREGWITTRFQATSGRDLYITIATAAKNLGMKWTPAAGGFEDLNTGKVQVVKSEEEIFEIARLPYVPPEKRSRWLEFAVKESGLPPTLTKEQMREWAAGVTWTDTTCGGEFHQYTFRKAGDEHDFVHVAECIRELGYDGKYLRRKWRYLDLDDHFYFSCGASIETTALINRKKLRQEETAWAKNLVPWIPLTQPDARNARAGEQQQMLWDVAVSERSLSVEQKSDRKIES